MTDDISGQKIVVSKALIQNSEREFLVFGEKEEEREFYAVPDSITIPLARTPASPR